MLALPPNAKFHSVEELKLVRGFEENKYKLIAPYLSTAPVQESPVILIPLQLFFWRVWMKSWM